MCPIASCGLDCNTQEGKRIRRKRITGRGICPGRAVNEVTGRGTDIIVPLLRVDLGLPIAYYPRAERGWRARERVDERLGAHTGEFRRAVNATAPFLDSERPPSGNVTFAITVKEFAVPPPGQRVRFYAEADKPVNQKIAPLVPCGWGASIFSALGDCVRLIRQFPYEGEERTAS